MSANSDQIIENTNPSQQLRLWPAICISIALVAAMTIPGWFAPMTRVQFFGLVWFPLLGTLLFVFWWLFASRRPSWTQRIVGVVAVVAAVILAAFEADSSVILAMITRGMVSLIVAITLWFVVARSLAWRTQLIGASVTTVLILAFWCALRTAGVDGTLTPEFAWRWTPTPEQEYLASLPASQSEAIETTEQMEASPGDWVGFRGPQRNSRVEGVDIDTDWESHPPREVWRRPIGPGWSSFAVIGDRLYTQEQREDNEVVLCLDAETGDEIWAHQDEARFWESLAGAGPRATPTFDGGRIFTLGATGILNCLDAGTGNVIWSADIAADGEVETPTWGFASSPLVLDDLVIVYAGGGPDGALIAYQRDTGVRRWRAGNGTISYSSPQLATFDNVPQVLMLTKEGVFSVSPESGDLLWQHTWLIAQPPRVVQPNVMSNHVFLGHGFSNGTQSILVQHVGDSWQAETDWMSRAFSPYYNDFVIYDNQLYGFDGNVFASVDATTGKRNWKRGRYGNGQVLLLADQGLLLVLSETGDLVLLRATPDKLEELGRMKAIEGKTWNHPVLAKGRLFVRNAEEAACFSLSLLPDDR